MTETLTQRLQRAVALRDAASPAPWFRNIIGTGYGAAVLCSTAMRHSAESDKFRICTVPIYGNLEGNAALIAAAPSIVQLAVELGAECERLRAELALKPQQLAYLNGRQIKALIDFADSEDDADLCIQWFAECPPDGEGNLFPEGLWAFFAEYPEEGRIFLSEDGDSNAQ